MSFFALSGLINAAASTLFGVLAYFKNPQNIKNRVYAFYCFTLSLWSYFYFFWQISKTEEQALFFARGLMMGAILIPVAHYHHVLKLFDLPNTKFLRFGYWFSAVLLISNFTPWFVSGVEPRSYFLFWPVPGPFFHLYMMGFGLYVVLTFYTIFKVYRTQPGEIKNQIFYVIVASLIGYGLGSTNFLLWYKIPIPPWGNIAVTIYTTTVFYILVRYKLLDITLVTRDTIVYTAAIAIFAFPLIIIAYFFPTQTTPLFWVLFGITAFFLPMSHPRIVEWIQPRVDKYVFWDKFSYLKDFYALGKEVPQVTNLKEFLPNLAEKLVTTVKVEWSRVLLIEGLSFAARFQGYYAWDKEEEWAEWSNDLANALLEKLKKSPQVLLRNDIMKDLLVMAKLPTGIVIDGLAPLRSEDRVYGMIALGPKIQKNAMFHQRDVEALMNVANTVAPILWANFAFYEQAIKVEEGLHDSLNFILSADALANMPGVPPGMGEQLENARTLLADLRLTNQITIRRQRGEKLKCERYNLRKVLENVCTGERLKAKAKSLDFALEMSNQLPDALGDSSAMKRIVENIVHNAVKYTKHGKVTLRATVSGDFIKIDCEDTGPGIPEKDLPHIFEAFYRAPGQRLEEGTGLGLYIVRELAEAQGGRVEIESSMGKGTVLHLQVPIARADG